MRSSLLTETSFNRKPGDSPSLAVFFCYVTIRGTSGAVLGGVLFME